MYLVSALPIHDRLTRGTFSSHPICSLHTLTIYTPTPTHTAPSSVTNLRHFDSPGSRMRVLLLFHRMSINTTMFLSYSHSHCISTTIAPPFSCSMRMHSSSRHAKTPLRNSATVPPTLLSYTAAHPTHYDFRPPHPKLCPSFPDIPFHRLPLPTAASP